VPRIVVALVVVLFAVLGSAACRADDGGARFAPGTVSKRPLVALVRSGGADGHQDRVEVDSTGEAVISGDSPSRPRAQMLSASELSALRTALEGSQIATLRRNYLDTRAEIAFQYDITYQGVTVTTDAGVVPRQLQRVVEVLDKLLG